MHTVIAPQAEALPTLSSLETGNPFPGLRPFYESESHLFFGRESQVDVMVDKLAALRFLAVVGTSGSGKSSLVNCGLRPALHHGLMAKAGIDWQMIQFRPGNNPVHALALAMAAEEQISGRFDFDATSLQEIIEATLRLSKLGISEVYQRAQLRANLLIVVDQFEELFRYRQLEPSAAAASSRSFSEEATAFVNLLLEARWQLALPIYVVITMRSDFLGDCAEFLGLPEAINEGQYLIPRMMRDERRAAIAGPIGVGRAKISPVLLTQLVNDVGDNPDQLSILQHALNRTWAKWQYDAKAEGEIALSHYEAIGTMAHALDRHAEKAYGELRDQRQRRICEKIFRALTDKGTDPRGIRRPTSFGTLCDLAQAAPAEVGEVIDVFRKPSRSFLMPPLPESLKSELDFNKVVDISHESFMRIWERLKKWTDEEVQSAYLYRRLSEDAALHAEKKKGLWGDPELQLALDWEEKEEPTEAWANLYGGGFAQARNFLRQSEEQRNQKIEQEEERRKQELRRAEELARQASIMAQQAQELAEERQHRLDQANQLSDERQQRIEEQARYARKLQFRWKALASLVVALVLIAGYAWHKRHEALQNETKAITNENLANENAKLADQRAKEAQEAKAQAVEADTEMRLEALRARDATRDVMWEYGAIAHRLTWSVSLEESALWQRKEGRVLAQVGDLEAAERFLSASLELSPDDADARTTRGYLYLKQKRPRAALRDFAYIRDNIDRGSPLNNLNLTVVQAQLGDYAAAGKSLKRALDHVDSRNFSGEEDLIPPEITTALGRKTLEADRATFKTALYYMQANLAAYSGNRKAFESDLEQADKAAGAMSPAFRRDAYLIAMTWAWLHLGVRCPDPEKTCRDYGAVVSQAALWERVQRKDWAACYYQRFQKLHTRWADPRYPDFASLSQSRLQELNVKPAEACLTPPEHDALTLETEARDAFTRRNYHEAALLYDQALRKAPEPDQMRLMLAKAEALMQMGRAISRKQKQQAKYAFLQVMQLSSEMLRRNPREAYAYFYRSYAQAWLDDSSTASRARVLADLQSALRLDPANIHALSLLDSMVPYDSEGAQLTDEQFVEMINYLLRYRDLLSRYYRLSPYSDQACFHQAILALHDGRRQDALDSVNRAIALNPEEIRWYRGKKIIRLAMGSSEQEADDELYKGYVRAQSVAEARGETEKAEAAQKAIEEYQKQHEGTSD
jgi:energy-coupling factor transporter ATP-binding protein EcfA2